MHPGDKSRRNQHVKLPWSGDFLHQLPAPLLQQFNTLYLIWAVSRQQQFSCCTVRISFWKFPGYDHSVSSDCFQSETETSCVTQPDDVLYNIECCVKKCMSCVAFHFTWHVTDTTSSRWRIVRDMTCLTSQFYVWRIRWVTSCVASQARHITGYTVCRRILWHENLFTIVRWCIRQYIWGWVKMSWAL